MLYKLLKRTLFALFISMVVLLVFFLNHASGANLEPTEPISVQEYAYNQVVETWGEDQWESFNAIISQESRNWEVTGDHNLELSSAFGLAGFLDGTWETVGCVKTDNQYQQIDCAIKYIQMRKGYGTPDKAWQFHLENNWY